MARRVCQVLLGLVLLYAGAVAAFAWLHYRRGERPDVVTTAAEMHRWVGGLFASRPAAPTEPGALPPPRGDPPPPPPAAEPPPPPPATDPRSLALARVRDDLLPAAERLVREIPGGAGDLADRKAAARVALVRARDVLGPLLDTDSHDRDAQALYRRVMDLLIAVDKR